MKNVSREFNQQYVPYKALLMYKCVEEDNHTNQYQNDTEPQIYVESFDIGKQGKPINAHPLSVKEMLGLSELLQSTQEIKGGYLKSRGIMPNKVLYINPQNNGHAIWYTPPQEVNLFFIDSLTIPSGKAKIPGMVWKATKESIQVFAIKGKAKPTEKTVLCHAPYFNTSNNGTVCMGTVTINIDRNTALEDFMAQWESYFFGSYFSHSIGGHSNSKVNIVQLWQGQAGTGKNFPQEVLVNNGMNLKQLMQ
ncbi:PRTRC system protein B [Mucilaginibacter sp. L196]|uniref:PRTRC system protein B n=1 Tax=Mucilaginibacter sp. L196 TaxID=1641870 RepID=UPI00131CA10E|nr:PRTRC system protein B [Mucilaginibacter sp. L196]